MIPATEIGQSQPPFQSDDGRAPPGPVLDPALACDLLRLADKSSGASQGLQVLQLVPVPVLVCDAGGELTFCNRTAVELIGCEPRLREPAERFCGCLKLLRAEGVPVPADESPLAVAVREGRSFRNLEARAMRPDGTVFFASISADPIRDAKGEVCGAMYVWHDISSRRAVEDRLRTREMEFQLIRAHAPVILSHWDRDNRLVFASQAFAERWGVPPEKLLGKTVAEVLGETAYEALRPYVQRVLAGEAVEFEMDVPYHGVGRRYVRAAYAPVRGEDGDVRGYLAVATDMTERRNAEGALRASEERLRLATRTGKVGLWDWDVGANRVTWTESLYHLHGVDPAGFTVTLESFGTLIHPEDRAPVQRAIRSAIEHGARYELEFRAVRPRGGTVWLFTTAEVIFENGRAVRMIGATLDITARKTAELALRESEGRFRALASHAPVGIFLTDGNGDCVFVNESWRMMTGLSPDQARGKGWLKALHPDDRQRIREEWYGSAEERRPFAAEYRYLRPDGTVSWVEGTAVESRNASGLPNGHIGIVVDVTRRKAAVEALRESEKRFRTLASHAPVGIFLTDPSGDTMFVNEAWCSMVGVDLAQARGRGWAAALHPEDRPRVVAEWESALANGAPSQSEYRFLRADGSTRWVHGCAVQLHDDAGRLVGYIGTISDVTERKHAEEQLRAQEKQLRLISTNAPISLAQCNRDGRFLFVNRVYAERFGLTPSEILGRRVADVIGRDAAGLVQGYIDRVLAGETVTYDIEVPYPKLGRRFMHVAYVPDYGADGAVRGWLSAITDITEQKRTEDALRRLAAIVESSDDAIISKDLDGHITSWNKGAERIFGYTAEEAIGQSILMLIPDDRRDEEPAVIERIRSGEQLYHFETLRRRKDGSLVDVSFSISPLCDASGQVTGASIIARDITAQKAAEAELRIAQQALQAHAAQLEQKVAERTASLREAIVQMEEFSYSVSHDLRAPLRAMNAYAQALAEDYGGQLDDTARNYLERIQRSAARMENLTRDVLTYSRVARADVRLAPIDVELVVRDIVSQYAELQPPAADVDLASPLVPVLGHEASLGQVLANLLTNAAKFVAPGVRPAIRVRTERVNDSIRLWVEDNGIGIAPRFHDRLFRVFERVPTDRPYEGTGIGLAIVRKALEKMGGRCGVKSELGRGSRFWIELPPA